MAATTGTHPRRKLNTYGKASRNSVLGCRSIVSNVGVGEDSKNSYVFEGTVFGGIRKDGFPITGALREYCSPMAKIQSDLTVERGVKEECLHYRATSKDLSQTQGERDGSFYHVPSSGEEQDDTLRGDPPKKRKTCKIRTGDGSGVAYGDDSFQEHIGAEIGQNNHTYPCPVNFSLRRNHALAQVHPQSSDLTSRVIVMDSIEVPSECDPISLRNGAFWRPNSGPSSTEHIITSKSGWSFPTKKVSDSRSKTRRVGVPLGRPTTTPQATRPTIHGSTTPSQQAPQYLRAELEDFPSPSATSIRDLQNAYLPKTCTSKDSYCQYEGPCPTVLKTLRTKLVDKLHRTRECPNPTIECDSEGERSEDNSAFHVAEPSDVQHGGDLTEDICSGSDSQSSGNKMRNATRTYITKLVPGIHGGSQKVTYARQRSYLTEDDVNDTAMFPIPSNLDFTPNLLSSNQRKIKTVSNAQQSRYRNLEVEDSKDGHSGAIRSIHELREAGGSARLVGEMQAILEDINDTSSTPLSLQRSSLLELVTKLEKSSFCRSFIDHGLESRLFAHVGFCTDNIVNMLLMVSFIYILAEPCLQHTLDSINNQRTVDYLIGYLKNTDELASTASNRNSNMSKARQLDIQNLCDSLAGSSAWRSGRPLHITARTLSLQCLAYLVQHVHEAVCTSDTLSRSITTALVDMMVACIPHPIPDPPLGTIAEFLLAISILESTTASRAATNSVQSVWTSGSTTKIVYLLPIIQTWSGEGIERLRTLALRLSLNLTNNNQSSCQAFSKVEMVNVTMITIVLSFRQLSSKLIKNNQIKVLDNLVLALGLLTNLAEWSEITQELFVTSFIDGNTWLDTLIHIFKTNSAKISEVLLLLDQL